MASNKGMLILTCLKISKISWSFVPFLDAYSLWEKGATILGLGNGSLCSPSLFFSSRESLTLSSIFATSLLIIFSLRSVVIDFTYSGCSCWSFGLDCGWAGNFYFSLAFSCASILSIEFLRSLIDCIVFWFIWVCPWIKAYSVSSRDLLGGI